MAIQTSGHQVQVMPQYEAPDPSLVAFNPNRATQGALAALQLVDAVNKIHAFQQQQQELQALAPERLAAKKAGYGTDVLNYENLLKTAPSGVGATIAGNEAVIKTAPSAATRQVAQDASAVKVLPSKEAAEIATNAATAQTAPEVAKATVAGAQSTVADLRDKEDLRDQNFRAQQQELKAKIAEAALAKAKADDDLASMPEDKDRKDRAQEADIALKNATAAYHQSQADYFTKGGPTQAKNQAIEAYKVASNEHSRAVNELVRLGATPVPDPQNPGGLIKLSQLKDAMFDETPDGLQPKKSGVIFTSTTKPDQQSIALIQQYDAALKAAKDSGDQMDQLKGSIFLPKQTPPSGSGNTSPSPSASGGALTPEQARAKIASTKAGEEFTYVGTDGVTRKAKGTKK